MSHLWINVFPSTCRFVYRMAIARRHPTRSPAILRIAARKKSKLELRLLFYFLFCRRHSVARTNERMPPLRYFLIPFRQASGAERWYMCSNSTRSQRLAVCSLALRVYILLWVKWSFGTPKNAVLVWKAAITNNEVWRVLQGARRILFLWIYAI